MPRTKTPPEGKPAFTEPETAALTYLITSIRSRDIQEELRDIEEIFKAIRKAIAKLAEDAQNTEIEIKIAATDPPSVILTETTHHTKRTLVQILTDRLGTTSPESHQELTVYSDRFINRDTKGKLHENSIAVGKQELLTLLRQFNLKLAKAQRQLEARTTTGKHRKP
ncbi:MAG: hypothetical protein WC285_02775 [Candidatus Gracilibacteria bacterium]|jgi:hypothetical protein